MNKAKMLGKAVVFSCIHMPYSPEWRNAKWEAELEREVGCQAVEHPECCAEEFGLCAGCKEGTRGFE